MSSKHYRNKIITRSNIMSDNLLKVEQIIDTFHDCTTEQKDNLIQVVVNMHDTFWKYEVIKVIFKDCNYGQKNELIQTMQMSFKAFDEVQNNDFITVMLSIENAFYAYKALKVILEDCSKDQIDALMPNIELLSQKTTLKNSTSAPEIMEKLNKVLFSEDIVYQIYANAQQTHDKFQEYEEATVENNIANEISNASIHTAMDEL
jgi:hypothetical protein